MGRILALLYGLAAYLFFLVTFLYAMGFVIGIAVPKTIDTGPAAPVAEAMAVDLTLLALFAVQHSVMARAAFKQWLTRIVPQAIERSTYVLLATLALALLLWQWRPIPFVVWQATNPVLANVLIGVGLLGWLIAVVSTFLIDHFELFGLRQIGINLAGGKVLAPQFKTPALYRIVRHPLYFGFLLAFWSAPLMTAGHLLFAAGMTVYIFIGTLFEERDLIRQFGEDYRRYRKRVAMLIPLRWGM